MTTITATKTTSKDALFNLCNQYVDCLITESTYQECANFLFYTSWFEELLFNDSKQQGISNDEKICQDLAPLLNIHCFDFFGEYFQMRYFDSLGNTTAQFSRLKLSPKISEKVKNTLWNYKQSETLLEDILFCYLMIIYRFRNNLFHGGKGLNNINHFVSEFQIINQFMNMLMTEILNINYKGYN